MLDFVVETSNCKTTTRVSELDSILRERKLP